MKNSYWIYGVFAGILLVSLQILKYRFWIRDLRIELFAGLIALIFLVMGIWLGTTLIKKRRFGLNPVSARHHGLSERELDVLYMLAEGHSNQELADRLFISLNTAKTHISSIYRKLHVTRRVQAIQKARELGILDADDDVRP